MYRASIVLLLVAAAGPRQAGCNNKTPHASPTPVTTPATSPKASPSPSPTPPPAEPPPAPLPPIDDIAYPLAPDWCTIDEQADEGERAWVEGSVWDAEKVVIDTHNVRRFTLNLAALRVDWKQRIVLRMDGYNSQLTRKHWPKIRFERTPSGGWSVVEEDEASP